MKRLVLAILLFVPLTAVFAADNFDVKGLQPLPPFGVFSTFSAESLKQNKVGLAFQFDRSVDPNFYRFLFQIAYGLHDRFEINMTLPYVADWQDSVDGFEDVNLGIKHRLFDETKYAPAVGYLFMVAAPSGRDEFSTDGNIGGGLILTKKVGPFKGHLNALYLNPFESGLKDQYILNLGAELAISHNSKVIAELVGKKDYFKNKLNLLEWRIGYRIATTEYIYTTVGAGFDIKNRTPDYRLLFSISVILPKEKAKIKKIYEE